MNRIIKFLPLIIAGVMMGCQDDKPQDPVASVKAGDFIDFSLGTAEASRTHYDGEDSYHMDWDLNIDTMVLAYSESSHEKDGLFLSAYKVREVYSPNSEHAYHAAVTPIETNKYANGIKWMSGSNHHFFGAYPYRRITGYVINDGNDPKFQFIYNTNQQVTVGKKDGDNCYHTTPEMENAYMCAKLFSQVNISDDENVSTPLQSHIIMDFDPIMTTFNITLKVSSGPLKITGVSLLLPFALGQDNFQYHQNHPTSPLDAQKGIGTFDSSISGGVCRESIFVGIKNGNENFITLQSGESLKLLAFMPPFPTNQFNYYENKFLKFKVHAVGKEDFVAIYHGEDIKLNQWETISGYIPRPQSKINVQLPELAKNQNAVNKWMHYMGTPTQVKDLSIPGVILKTQDKEEIEDYLARGIRAFDISQIAGTFNAKIIDDFLTHEHEGGVIEHNDIVFLIISEGQNSRITTNRDLVKWDIKEHTIKSVMDIAGQNCNAIIALEKTKTKTGENDLKSFPRPGIEPEYVPIHIANDHFDYDRQTLVDPENEDSHWICHYIQEGADQDKLIKNLSSYRYREGNIGIVFINSLDQNNGDILLQSIIDLNFKTIKKVEN